MQELRELATPVPAAREVLVRAVPQALADIQAGRVTGKLVIRVRDEA